MAELIALGMVKMIDMRDEIITKWIIRSQVLIWEFFRLPSGCSSETKW